MDRDVEERREFEERLRKRDEERTRKLAEPKLSRAEKEEAARRRYGALFPSLVGIIL